eukprot:scaffold12086_cov66-Cyclotella_meneghiniana.AAC.6
MVLEGGVRVAREGHWRESEKGAVVKGGERTGQKRDGCGGDGRQGGEAVSPWCFDDGVAAMVAAAAALQALRNSGTAMGGRIWDLRRRRMK